MSTPIAYSPEIIIQVLDTMQFIEDIIGVCTDYIESGSYTGSVLIQYLKYRAQTKGLEMKRYDDRCWWYFSKPWTYSITKCCRELNYYYEPHPIESSIDIDNDRALVDIIRIFDAVDELIIHINGITGDDDREGGDTMVIATQTTAAVRASSTSINRWNDIYNKLYSLVIDSRNYYAYWRNRGPIRVSIVPNSVNMRVIRSFNIICGPGLTVL